MREANRFPVGLVKTRILFLMLFCLFGGSLGRSPAAAQVKTLCAVNGQTVASRQRVAVSWSNPRSSLRADNGFPEDFGMPRANDLLCHRRIRTRRSIDSNLQGHCCVANCGQVSLTQCGTVVAARDTAQSFIFLGASTVRGPPWSGNQNLYPLNGALDCLVQHFCAAPFLAEGRKCGRASDRRAP